MGQALRILPNNQEAEQIVTKGVEFNLYDKETTATQVYLGLSYLRWMREAPMVVRHTLRLAYDGGRDFWAAAMFAHFCGCHFLDHSILPFKGLFVVSGYDKRAFRDLGLVLRLYDVLCGPKEADSRSFKSFWSDRSEHRWDWQTKTLLPKKSFYLEDRMMLLSSEVYPVIAAGSLKKATEKVQELTKLKGSHVKFSP